MSAKTDPNGDAGAGPVERPVRPLAQWGDWDVQSAYSVLCSDEQPPEGEHWEGYAARRIAAELRFIYGVKAEVQRTWRTVAWASSAVMAAYLATHVVVRVLAA